MIEYSLYRDEFPAYDNFDQLHDPVWRMLRVKNKERAKGIEWEQSWIQYINPHLKKYNAVISFNHEQMTLQFDSEEGYIKFLLEWA